MTSLALKSIMYGADKIPDKWFEKVPGGFYKEKEQREERDRKDKRSQDKDKKDKRDRRNSDGQRERPKRSERPRSRDRDGHRSDNGHRRDQRRSRSSYDGYDDFDDEDYERRRREKDRRRRRTGDDDRYGFDDGYGRAPRNPADHYPPPRRSRDDRPDRPYNPAEYGGVGSHPDADYYMGRGGPPPSRAPPPGQGQFSPVPHSPVAPVAGAAAGVAASQYQNGGRPTSSGTANGYVPYADLYQPQAVQPPPMGAQAPRDPYNARPPRSDNDSPYAHSQNQVAPPMHDPVPPPQGYQQDPYAQVAPAAAAAAGAAYAAPFNEPPYPEHLDPRYARDYDDYPPSDRSYSRSPPRRHRSRRDRRSRSRSRSDSRDSYDSRSRHHGRPPPSGTGSGKRGKSSIRDHLDTSERGMGYGAIGALAGGLVGNEMGKGILPTAAGAVVGALGTNAFQARENGGSKRREQRNSGKYAADDGYRPRSGHYEEYDDYDDDRDRRQQKRTSRRSNGYYSD